MEIISCDHRFYPLKELDYVYTHDDDDYDERRAITLSSSSDRVPKTPTFHDRKKKKLPKNESFHHVVKLVTLFRLDRFHG